jgi:hypothetical protein
MLLPKHRGKKHENDPTWRSGMPVDAGGDAKEWDSDE